MVAALQARCQQGCFGVIGGVLGNYDLQRRATLQVGPEIQQPGAATVLQSNQSDWSVNQFAKTVQSEKSNQFIQSSPVHSQKLNQLNCLNYQSRLGISTLLKSLQSEVLVETEHLRRPFFRCVHQIIESVVQHLRAKRTNDQTRGPSTADDTMKLLISPPS